jgi:hypothetical protein
VVLTITGALVGLLFLALALAVPLGWLLWRQPPNRVADRPPAPSPAVRLEIENLPQPLPQPEAKQAQPLKVADAEVAGMLAEVKLPNRIGELVAWFVRTAPPAERPDAAAPFLEAVVQNTDLNLHIRCDAARALGHWGRPASVAVLIALFADEPVLLRHAAIEGLGTWGGEKAAAAIVQRLTNEQDRGRASSTLQTMGEQARRPVLLALEDESPAVRAEARKILKEIGR